MIDYKTYMDEIKTLPNKNVIYLLCDPITNEVRYVGKAINLYIRIRKHHNESRLKAKTHKNNWIKSLLTQGLKAKVLVIEECLCENSLNEAEKKWIKYYKQIGCDLTNGTEGGDGGKMSQEAIEKMRTSKIGKSFSKEHREAISKSHKNKILSKETREKIGIKHKNKIVSKESREKMRTARLNYLLSISKL